jgi:hypothetical protein
MDRIIGGWFHSSSCGCWNDGESSEFFGISKVEFSSKWKLFGKLIFKYFSQIFQQEFNKYLLNSIGIFRYFPTLVHLFAVSAIPYRYKSPES